MWIISSDSHTHQLLTSASILPCSYFYPRIVSAYEETAEADDVGVVKEDE